MIFHDTPEDEQDHHDRLRQALDDHRDLHPDHHRERGRVAEFREQDESYREVADRLPPSGVDVLSDLYREELRDVGHAIDKHVGCSADELREFPSYDSEAGASSFDTPGQAADAVNDALYHSAGDMVAWLVSDNPDHFVCDTDLGRTTGRWARSRDHADGIEVTGIRVVLARDDDDPRGFVFRTAFPIPSDQVRGAGRRRT
ncbi:MULTISPECIES: RNase A-like domain-containing protein [unclassified Streptomyces]|uniref:RNase A-like domain-containing protein n=1 Tax=unclassified Streptomyces TaxID=2593676 RepID=UPI003D7474DD